MSTDLGLSPLTRVPLSDAPLPALDPVRPAWPGEEVTAGGERLFLRRTPGPGETAVYVHGLGGSATNWTDLAGQLRGHVNGIAVDLPGFGRSRPADGFTFTMAEHAAVLARFLSGLDLGGPVHLFGNSMGGAISMLLAAEHPDLVRTLTLVSPAVPDLRPSFRRMSDPRLPLLFLPVVGPRVRRQFAAMPPRERAMQLMRLCFADPSAIPEARMVEAEQEFAERAAMAWAGRALMMSTSGLIRSWLVPRARSMWTLAARLTMPTLVVWGTEDRLVTVRKAPRIAAALPRARLLVLPRTGHVAQMERPRTVARAVLGMWEAGDTW